jgi:hypothetical protein
MNEPRERQIDVMAARERAGLGEQPRGILLEYPEARLRPGDDAHLAGRFTISSSKQPAIVL